MKDKLVCILARRLCPFSLGPEYSQVKHIEGLQRQIACIAFGFLQLLYFREKIRIANILIAPH